MKAFVTTKERLCNFLCVTVIVPNKYFDFQYVFLLITTACIEAKPPPQQVFFFCNFCANSKQKLFMQYIFRIRIAWGKV